MTAATVVHLIECDRCHAIDRLPDDAEGCPRMCGRCGAIGCLKWYRIDDPIPEMLERFPSPTMSDIGVPL